MSENAVKHPLETPHQVERNGIIKTLKCFVGKRGAWENKPYQAPQLEIGTFDDDVTWIGKENIVNAYNVILKRFGQDYVEDATGETDGIFSLERFLNYWKELRASALKLSELQEAYQNAVSEYTTFAAEGLMAAVDSGDPEKIAAAKKKMGELSATITALKKDFDERKARRSKEAATETTQPA